MAFSPRERAFVEDARVGRLASADADGRPHAVPICFALIEGLLVSPLDEKPKEVGPKSLRRVQNVAMNPMVSVIVDRYTEDWDRLGWVRIDGRCTVREADDSNHGRVIAALRAKYDQYETQRLEDRPYLAIEPETVTSWGTLAWS